MRADALTFGCLLAGTAAAFTFGAHVLNRLALDRRFRDLDADIEWNLLSWLGSAAILTSAVATALLALVLRRPLLAALALGLSFLSLDELSEVHERIGRRLGEGLGLASGEEAARWWIAIYLPALVVGAVFLWGLAGEARARSTRRTVRVALGLLAAAVVTEAIGAGTTRLDGDLSWVYVVNVGLEEALETGGWLLLATGVTMLALEALPGPGGSGAEGRRSVAEPRGDPRADETRPTTFLMELVGLEPTTSWCDCDCCSLLQRPSTCPG